MKLHTVRVTAERTAQTGIIWLKPDYTIHAVENETWGMMVGKPLRELLARLSPAKVEQMDHD